MKQRADEFRASTEKLGHTSAFDNMINDAKELLGEFTGKDVRLRKMLLTG